MTSLSTSLEKASDNYFARMRRGQVPPPPICALLGANIGAVDLQAGTLESAYQATPAFLNPAGQVQGGMLGAMLDDVTAMLVTATLGAEEFCATLNLNLSFLRPASAGELLGRARLERRGKNVCYVAAELLQDGRAVATATATCMLVSRASG
ncbi:PaaI family thioesterase [Cupriavidus sp. L7L]|uniref:PaaI family thioesterase n=1 Tax=Cupriavidus sp. L7L TaxID=2546443 RepID=UPI001055B910|nr:PaaI family thioesterase [Cupriavidus sp. L7L]TDF63815.1 PaaI family thioesterase [Cupriavidus sp. L7L]